MRILRMLAWTAGAIAILFAATVAYLAATFNPDAYRQQLIDWVKTEHQRTLRLDGAIRLSFWPDIGMDLGKASLSERGSGKAFAEIGRLRLSVKLLPLLSKQLMIDEIALGDASVNIIRDKDGRLNTADLTRGQGSSAGLQLQWAVSRVTVCGLAIRYRDEGSGTSWTASDIRLVAGGIAAGRSADVKWAMKLSSPEAATVLSLDGEAGASFAPGGGVKISRLRAGLTGNAAGFSDISVRLSGALEAALDGRLQAADQLELKGAGRHGGRSFSGRIAVRNLKGDGVRAAGAMNGEIEVTEGSRRVKGQADAMFAADVQQRRVSLSDIRITLDGSDPHWPKQGLRGQLQGSGSADFLQSGYDLKLSGSFAGAALRAGLRQTRAGRPIEFDIDADALDIDALLPAAGPAAAGAQTQQVPPAADPAPDWSMLKPLHFAGRLRLGLLQINRLTLKDVRATLRAAGGVVTLASLTAAAYGGKVVASGRVDASGAVPVFSARKQLDGIALAPLLKDAAQNDRLEGRAFIRADLTSRGATLAAMKRGLQGQASFRVADGLIRGVDIAGTLRKARDWSDAARGKVAPVIDRQEKTDFSELSASFRIVDGIARSSDLAMKSPLLRASGEGEMDLAAATINYLLKASVVATAKGQSGRDLPSLQGITVPIRLTGALADPVYRVDVEALMAGSARRKVEEAITRRLTGGGKAGEPGAARGGLEGALKGLLGR